MNTRKLTGDMASSVERDREELVEMREVLKWASENTQSVSCDDYDHWWVDWNNPELEKCHHAPTLYAALRSAWSNRKDKP